MRYEGLMKVTGEVRIVVDEPGLTLEEARAKAERSPGTYKCMFVENLEFEEWEDALEMTESDEDDDSGEEE